MLKEKCELRKKELAKAKAQRDLVQKIRAEQRPRCELLQKSLESCKKETAAKIDTLSTISSQVRCNLCFAIRSRAVLTHCLQFNQSLGTLEEQSTRLCSSIQRDKGAAAILEAYLQREEAFRVQLLSLGSIQQENKQSLLR